MINISLQSYLKFGYDLNYSNPNYKLDFSHIDKTKFECDDEKSLIKLGSELLFSSFDNLYNETQDYVVPLSGGADSRAILGLLLEFRKANDILTYTFGTPGTYDFDIGNSLAKAVGTNHISFDLTKHSYSEEEFMDASRRFDFQSPLFLHPPLGKLDSYFKDSTIISGANAGAVVGSFVPERASESLEEAFLKFCRKGSFTKSTKLHNCADSDFIPLMSVKPINPDLLTYDEQVFFNERSVKHLAPHVLIKGFEYVLPFINNSFMDFMLSIDNQYRKGKYLYKKILLYSFPDLFSYPSEGSYGLRPDANKHLILLKRYYIKIRQQFYQKHPKYFPYVSPMINYIDFDHHFRHNSEIRALLLDAITSLNDRGIIYWSRPLDLLNLHLKGKKNLALPLLTLFSLEYHLRAGKSL